MKKNPCFSLYNIAGTAYLLPYGQSIADHKRGICLNETGVFLWELLQHTLNRQELLTQFARHYEASTEELPQLEQDLTDFLDRLFALGILLDDTVLEHTQTDSVLFLGIGPLRIRLIGPAEAFTSELFPFRIAEPDCADLSIELKNAVLPVLESKIPLIQNPDLCVYEADGQYLLQFPQMPQLAGAILSENGGHATIYYTPPFSEQFRTNLFHAIRCIFLYTAQKHSCFALHSASILYQGQAWLFSGHSGMGKSTHTNLWKELFQTPVFNGDLNLLAIADGIPVVYGMPWCGTSGIACTGAYPLGGIVLLGRAAYDECVELTMNKKILLTAQRLVSPAWDACMLQQHLDFMSVLAARIRICLLKCTKTPAAAKTMKKWIDR